jgi:galactokinase/mevalonate kinase-like predicted kinase
MNIETLLAEAKANEPKTVYDMYKASCECSGDTDCNCPEEWDLPTFNGGGSARAVISGKILTLYYTDGTTATYTES